MDTQKNKAGVVINVEQSTKLCEIFVKLASVLLSKNDQDASQLLNKLFDVLRENQEKQLKAKHDLHQAFIKILTEADPGLLQPLHQLNY